MNKPWRIRKFRGDIIRTVNRRKILKNSEKNKYKADKSGFGSNRSQVYHSFQITFDKNE
jgi:hypothetical protein